MSSKEIKLSPKDIVFAIIGRTGAGKSTFINTAVGQNVTEVGETCTSCTERPLPIIIDPIPNYPALKGYRLVLLDTPGFDHSDGPEQDVKNLERIAEWLDVSQRAGALVGGVLYLYDITIKQFNATERRNLAKPSTSAWCNDMRKTVIVTTNWPSCSDPILEKREQEMKDEHWKTLIEAGLQVRRFQGDSSSAWRVIDSLLDGINASPPISRKGREIGPKDIVFPVMGPTGAGKSTFINIALGQVLTEVGHSTTGPCTKQPFPIIVYPIPKRPDLEGYRLVLLDTPGFDATHIIDGETFNSIARCLESFRKNGARIGGFLYVHDISVKRTSGRAPLSRFRVPTTMPKTALITTNWVDIDGALVQREREMKETCWKAFIDEGLRVFQFHQTFSDAWVIINYLLDHLDEVDVPFPVAQVDERSHRKIPEVTENFLKSIFRFFASL
ncbi:hypothetical protein M413DRAFT_193656 [Hebeloma cylindrosporum]|uniref:G domain-containing protein n=1 Tax=Hebeloma cylindrosporum TaxID=76867 RepID=A0A0C3BSG3_HEBCY|nr:hypothetical protein M413DRAFT_193656 [Hebeloma cylindrosporum h7]